MTDQPRDYLPRVYRDLRAENPDVAKRPRDNSRSPMALM